MQLLFLMYSHSHQKFLKWSFSILNVVWMSKIRCVSKNNFILHTHPTKGVRKICWKHRTLLKWNSTTNTVMVICKNFYFSERHQGDNFHICFNGWLMLRQLNVQNFKWRELIKMIQSLLVTRKMSLFQS